MIEARTVRTGIYEIMTWDLKVIGPTPTSRGHWSFQYKVKQNGKIHKQGRLDSTYTVSCNSIRAAFRRGYAEKLVLQQLA